MHFRKVKGILSSKNGMNLFRGCTHGCIYCDSRSACYQMQHVFEDVEVKENALDLLELTLRKRRKKSMLFMGAMTDPYIQVEMKLGHTRRALEIIHKYGFGISLITKSAGVLRDIDLLQAIQAKTKAVVQMTLTTYDESLCKIIEPHVSTTKERFAALQALQKAEIPTVVWLCPILPYINDTEENLLGLLQYCKEAKVKGIFCYGMGLTLREGNREYYYQALDRYFPGLKEKYCKVYGNAYVLMSPNNEKLMKMFHNFCEKENILHHNAEVYHYLKKFEEKGQAEQLSFFDL